MDAGNVLRRGVGRPAESHRTLAVVMVRVSGGALLVRQSLIEAAVEDLGIIVAAQRGIEAAARVLAGTLHHSVRVVVFLVGVTREV